MPTDAPPARIAPALRDPVDLADDVLAQQSLELMGLSAGTSCSACHGLTRQQLSHWRALSDAALETCLTDLAVADASSAQAMIGCMRAVPEGDFAAGRLGIYATATSLAWFTYVFERAYGPDAAAQQALLQAQAGMPRGDRPLLDQAQFDVVAEWFARGLPRLDENLRADPPPTTCTPGISAEVGTHVAAMATAGWRALDRAAMMAMYGCGSATDPRDCLTTLPSVDSLAALGHLRVLANVTYETQFWTRASADGRFLARGVIGVTGSYVEDLQRGARVPIAAEYDPAFFPDNAGFSYQGTSNNTCAMSVLTSNPDAVTMTETGCSKVLTLGQYQHMARALAGDYVGADGQFVSDDGGKAATTPALPAHFTSSATLDVTPMIFDGTTFVAKPRVRVATPFEGDVVLSPSARLAMTRVAGANDAQLGYVLRRVEATDTTVSAPEIARYCIDGGKPAFSYDERWITFHRYETDRSNVYLMELTTGAVTQVTDMPAGQYALYPHFRADGWIYLQVRAPGTGHEQTLASDAALLLE